MCILSGNPNSSNRNIVPSVNKAIDIIILLSESPLLTFKSICSELDLPASTCYNLLNTLEGRGIISKNKQTAEYSLGITLMRLGLHAYNSLDIRKLALPFMQELAYKYDETCYLSIVNHSTVEGIVLERIESTKTLLVLHQVGSKFPLYASATGKSLLSGLSEEELDRYFSVVELIPFSKETVTEENKLRKEIEEIRKLGYATTCNDMGDQAAGISAPIKDYQGRVIAAVSLAGPIQRMEEQYEFMIRDIKETADKISQEVR